MKVSIITVCYNSSQYIRSAIDSVLSQSYNDIEYIVIDGGSSDETIKIIQERARDIQHIISEPDEGIYDAMNKGVALATGEIIGVLNSDDFYPNSNVISDVVDVFKKHADIDLLLGNVDFVSAENLVKPVRGYSSFKFSPWKMRFGFLPAHPAAFVKRNAYDCVGLYKLGYQTAADFDFFVRALITHKLKYSTLDMVLVRMRLGGASTSGLKAYWASSKEILRSLDENKISSNILFVLSRLLVKAFQMFLFRCKSLGKHNA